MTERKKIRISAVSFLNTLPFIYGIRNSDFMKDVELSLDTPAECAQKLISGKADLGLLPVAAIPELKEPHIISDYCIGSRGKVNSVLLLSEVPVQEIKNVLADYRSVTSARLLRILFKHHWHVSPELSTTHPGFENMIQFETAALVIGDDALLLKNKFPFVYDLSEAWFEMTALPFVFACWVSNRKLPRSFISQFNSALKTGIENIDQAAASVVMKNFPFAEITAYLKDNISYLLDEEKKKGMNLFFQLLETEKTGQPVKINQLLAAL